MKKGLFRLISILLALLLVPLAAFAEVAPPSKNADGDPYILNRLTGSVVDATAYKGKAIWLNFFAGWCGYCMEEMPDIKKIFETYSSDDLAIILVHEWSNEDADDSAAVVKRFGLEAMNLVEDKDMSLFAKFNPLGLPTSIFIDAQGYQVLNWPGFLTYEQMTNIMDTMGIRTQEKAAESQS